MPNHLVNETSPYLLQHVNNPVDWYPWCAEALELSRQSDRPIFLSIGYSACHWCHVMEHESFENPDIATLLNQWFVCIKVDREERPDLDQIYMNAVQAMTGSGGWPMSVFLTPQTKPFYGGTYWPPTARWGRPGFREILNGVHEAWSNRRRAVDEQADELTQFVQQIGTPETTRSVLGEATLLTAMNAILHSADRVHGGFGTAPKFPHPMDLRLGMRCWKRFRRSNASAADETLTVVTQTLDKMARGGIYDQLGGGFARYSTDERWLAPHFEKMLYDNAQLVPAYLEAYQITGQPEFARIARETLDYVLREMTQPEGGFYSTQDADSEGVEGKFFVWSEAEIDAVLSESFADSDSGRSEGKTVVSPEKRTEIFKRFYDVTANGNWEHSNILNRPETLEQAATELALGPEVLDAILADCRKKLFTARSSRVPPARDDKVLVSWNGLMIAAMSFGASVLREPRYAVAARAAADFILNRMIQCPQNPSAVDQSQSSELGDSTRQSASSFQLMHCFKEGRSRFNGYLDDYAALIDGLCELYQCVFDPKYLEAAIGLAERMLDQFWDHDAGGFYYTSTDHERLIARVKEAQDHATPSGNSLAVVGLLKLGRLTGRDDLEEKARQTLETISGQVTRTPLSAAMSLMALDFVCGPTHEIVVAVGSDDAVDDPFQALDSADEIQPFARIHQRFLPNKVIHRRSVGVNDEQLPHVTRSLLSGKTVRENKTTVYLCQQNVCGPPITNEDEFRTALETL